MMTTVFGSLIITSVSEDKISLLAIDPGYSLKVEYMILKILEKKYSETPKIKQRKSIHGFIVDV